MTQSDVVVSSSTPFSAACVFWDPQCIVLALICQTYFLGAKMLMHLLDNDLSMQTEGDSSGILDKHLKLFLTTGLVVCDAIIVLCEGLNFCDVF